MLTYFYETELTSFLLLKLLLELFKSKIKEDQSYHEESLKVCLVLFLL